jgi:hypothetical protein
MSLVDDYGRTEADIELLRPKLFARRLDTWPAERVEAALLEVSTTMCTDGNSPLVTVYSCGSRKYLQISNFGQRLQSKPKFPGPGEQRFTVDHGESPPRASRARSESESESEAKAKAKAKADNISAQPLPRSSKKKRTPAARLTKRR